MEEIYNDIAEIAIIENVNTSLCVCKLFEECGELAQAVNMTQGMKNTDKTQEEIKDLILEESVDVIQNIICIAQKFGITYEDILSKFPIKNQKWRRRIANKK